MNIRHKIILSYQPLVRHLASRFEPLLRSLHATAITPDDLIQEGNLGLIYALDHRLNPVTYVQKFIYEALNHYANILSVPRHTSAPLLSVALSDTVTYDDDDPLTYADLLPSDSTPLSDLLSAEEWSLICQTYQSLTPREQLILSSFFGIDSLSLLPKLPNRDSPQTVVLTHSPFSDSSIPFAPTALSTAEIASSLHLSTDRVKKLRQKSLKKLFSATR